MDLLRSSLLALCLGAGCASGAASAGPTADSPETGPVDPASVARMPEADRTRIMVLGTAHLAELPEELPARALEPLLRRLAEFRPDVIAVEALPGRSLEHYLARPDEYAVLLDAFPARFAIARDLGGAAQAATGLTRFQAEEAAHRRLPWGRLGDSERRVLVLQLIAALDLQSAALQWSYLPDGARIAADGLTPAMKSWLDEETSSRSEINRVARALARRLGLQRLAAVDDHSETDDTRAIVDQFEAIYTDEVLAAMRGDATRRGADRLKRRRDDILPLYRYLNSREFAAGDVRAQWGTLLRTRMESKEDRKRVALWEVRNLNIASNIRRLSVQVPGRRILVIFGAAHRPFIEASLSHAMDVRLVPAAQVLDD